MIWLLIAAGMCGAVAGSFVNVVASRVLVGDSALNGRSRCPDCRTQLRWFDSVPVLSWLVLRGRCGTCHQPISTRYPMVELTSAVVWILLALRFENGGVIDVWRFGISAVIASVLFAITLTDVDAGLIPNRITLPSGVVVTGLLLAAELFGGVDLTAALVGAVIYTAPILLFSLFGAMGFGDAKIAPIIGAGLGIISAQSLVIGMSAPYLLAAAPALVIMARGGRGARIIFGPALAGGWLVAVLAAEPITEWLGLAPLFAA